MNFKAWLQSANPGEVSKKKKKHQTIKKLQTAF